MPSNTRGKIKEHLEGCHRNTEGIKEHCNKMLILIDDKNPKMTEFVNAFLSLNNTLDEYAQRIYGLI